MPTKPLDRLLFAQGGLCFFCKEPMPKSEASVEHLVASVNGGSNSDENCVACCKAVNALFGSMSLKEKIQIVLNQRGHFKCPNGLSPVEPAEKSSASAKKLPAALPKKSADKTLAAAPSRKASIKLIVENLKARGTAKPKTLAKLKSSIATLFQKGFPPRELDALLSELQSSGKVILSENKVDYKL
jgi:HNH endonuclease